jgi:uncharacterized membrane protein (DUF2068 family)
MLLLTVEKSIGVVFFLAATIVLTILYIRGITHPIQNVFADELREDPHDLLANLLIRLLPEVSRRTLLALAGVAAGYLVLHVVEAFGLWRGRLWVEYLVLIETAAFLPYEAYEIARRFSWFKVIILAMNVTIVAFLAYRRLTQRNGATTASRPGRGI